MKQLIIIPVFLAAAYLFAAQATLDFFTAKSDTKDITVEWRSSKENDVLRYEIERSVMSQNDFKSVGTVEARGANSIYRYIDESAFRRENSGGEQVTAGTLYSYRLKMVGSDNQVSYSNAITVTHSVSSVRRTWGMIKEMFR